MTVYVDSAKNVCGRMKMAHMAADTLEELHATAAAIGLQREWFQDHRIPHYDVSQEKRKLAIQAGAIALEAEEIIRRINAQKNSAKKD